MVVDTIGAIEGLDTNNLWFLRVIASCKSSSMLWVWVSLPVPHNNKQNRGHESELQPLQLLPTTPCIVGGQV